MWRQFGFILMKSKLILNLFNLALDRNEDVPETTFTNFHISEYLQAFDSEKDYIGLMISSVKYNNIWYNDGRRHKNLSTGFKIAVFERKSSQ